MNTKPMTEEEVVRIIKRHISETLPFSKHRKELQALLTQSPKEQEDYVRSHYYPPYEQVADELWPYGRHSFHLVIRQSKAKRLGLALVIFAVLMCFFLPAAIELAVGSRTEDRMKHLIEQVADEGMNPAALRWAIVNVPNKAPQYKTTMNALAAAGNPEAMFYAAIYAASTVEDAERLITASANAGHGPAVEAMQYPRYKEWIAEWKATGTRP